MKVTALLEPTALSEPVAEVTGDLYRHLFRSRRLAVGESIQVVDGEGRARRAVIEWVGRRAARLRLEEELDSTEPERRVRLWVAVLRPERASWLVEKATELGVEAVEFFDSARSQRRLGPKDFERLHRVSGAALMQCGGARRPRIRGVHSWAEMTSLLTAKRSVVLDFGGSPLDSVIGEGAIDFLVGPEGGWEDSEREELRSLGAVSARLGARRLRVETAALAAASRLLAC